MAQNFQFHCLSCKKPSKKTRTSFTGCYSVGVVTKETGYKPLFSSDGGLRWTCPDCAKKIATLARELQKIVDPTDEFGIRLNALVNMDQEKE